MTRFHVLGERSSGTNFVKRLLAKNSQLKPTEALGWKHGFPHMTAIPPDLAVICLVRSADRWALSMHAKPWHSTPKMQALEFSDFIRAPWETIVDRPRYFGGDKAEPLLGQPLQLDRDPVTGEVFDTLFALRRAKLAGLLSYLNRDCSCILMRMEEVQDAPEPMLVRMLDAMEQPATSDPFRPVTRRLGARFKGVVPNRPPTPKDFPAQDMAFLRAQLDLRQEEALGYRYDL